MSQWRCSEHAPEQRGRGPRSRSTAAWNGTKLDGTETALRIEEHKKREGNRGSSALVAVVVFTAGDEVEMEEGAEVLPLNGAHKGNDPRTKVTAKWVQGVRRMGRKRGREIEIERRDVRHGHDRQDMHDALLMVLPN
uniref:Uncharacterized protein n=1 Tax=Oryza nivara TaxID=4536 RepID=A0A0E0GWF9_ORYNI